MILCTNYLCDFSRKAHKGFSQTLFFREKNYFPLRLYWNVHFLATSFLAPQPSVWWHCLCQHRDSAAPPLQELTIQGVADNGAHWIVAIIDERGESLSPPCGNTWSETIWGMFAHQAHRLLFCLALLPRKVDCVACRNVSPDSGAQGDSTGDLGEGGGQCGVPRTLLKNLSFSRLEADYGLGQHSRCSRSQSVEKLETGCVLIQVTAAAVTTLKTWGNCSWSSWTPWGTINEHQLTHPLPVQMEMWAASLWCFVLDFQCNCRTWQT